ncbi:MAG: cephalosporin hydroxylase family protein [Syntrophaceae bacterium]|nr:cephalosporin hydroxylase family protein [Syntrophaceae bacterium]
MGEKNMKLIIDTEAQSLLIEESGVVRHFDLYSKEAFERLSRQWVRVGWNQKYQYTFTWLGRPIIQLPEDMIRAQEIIFKIRPDVIVETGVAHGGSLIFYASLCKIMGNGRVVGIDIEIRPHNRRALEEHFLYRYITLIEGSSTAPEIINEARKLIKPNETVMIFLDSNHTKQHVLEELEAYSDFVTPGSYIVATDGIMKDLNDVPRGSQEWKWNNPAAAVSEFIRSHKGFVLEEPYRPFNESCLSKNITHWPEAWIKKI